MTCTARLRLLYFFLLINAAVLPAQSVGAWKATLQNSDPQVRTEALLELNKAYNQNQLDSAALYGQEALAQAQRAALDSLVRVSHAQLSLTYYYRRQLDSMLHHAQQGGQQAKRAKDDMLQAYCLKMEALAHSYLEDFAAAKERNEQALSIYASKQDTARMAGIYSNLGRLYQKQAIYDEALVQFIKAQKLFAQQDDHEGESVTAAQIGDLLLDLEKPQDALPYLHRALALTDQQQAPIRYGDLLLALGSVFNAEEMNLDSAHLYYERSRDLFTEIGDEQGLAIAHTNLGNLFVNKQDYPQALQSFHRGRAISLRNNWPAQIATNASNLGRYHQLHGQPDSAIHYFLEAYQLSEQHQFAFEEEAILESLYQHYKQAGQPAKALAIFEQYQVLRETTKSEAIEKEIAALQTRYETFQKEQEITRLELENKLQKNRSRTYLFGFTALSVVLLLLAGFLYYRRSKDQQLHAFEQKMLSQEKEKLDQEVQFKNKQLTSHALHMVQKNKVLQELRMGINDLTKGADAQQKKALRSLVRRIDFNIQADEDWETFRLYFEQTNQNFYKQLAQINAELTTADLKLCSLIKLNLNIKETAAVLNIEPTSVKTARHRLRKKLNLEPGQDLTAFIRQVA